MTEIFADLNDRDDQGLYSALLEDAIGPVSVGDVIRVVDDEQSVYIAHVTDVQDELVTFSLEPGLTGRTKQGSGLYAFA